ncbi:putative beta-1,4-xylosyltransferase IRX10L [Drosera capensis]
MRRLPRLVVLAMYWKTIQLKGFFVYELPRKYNKKILQKDPRCLTHMFAAEIFMHCFLLSSPVRTLNPEEADWFYTPVYSTCDLTPNGLPLPFKSPRMMRSAIQLISSNWPYWNRTEGADHFFCPAS